MSATVVQSDIEEFFAGSASANFPSNTTTGNTIVVVISHLSGTSGSYTASDAVNGAYVNQENNGGVALIRLKRGITGGFTAISITAPAGDSHYIVGIFEVSGLDNSATIVDGQVDEASTTTHVSTSAALTTTGFGVTVASFSSGGGTITPGSGWTLLSSGSAAGMIIQYKIAAFSSDTGQYTTSSAVITEGAMAIIPESSVVSGFPFITTIGAKRI